MEMQTLSHRWTLVGSGREVRVSRLGMLLSVSQLAHSTPSPI